MSSISLSNHNKENTTQNIMNSFMKRIAIATEHTMPDNKGYNRKQSCDPETLRFIKIRKDVVMRGNDGNVKEIPQITKKTARRIRTKKIAKGFKENTWDLIKNSKKDTHLNTQRCETSMEILLMTERAGTLANYLEQRQWHKTRQIPPEDNTPIEQSTRNQSEHTN